MDYLVPNITEESHLELMSVLISAIKIVTSKYRKNISKQKSIRFDYRTDYFIFKQVEQLINFINDSYKTSFQLVPTNMEIISYTKNDYSGLNTNLVPVTTKYLNYYDFIIGLDNCGNQRNIIHSEPWIIYNKSINKSINKSLFVNHKICLKATLLCLSLHPNIDIHRNIKNLVDERLNIITQFKSVSSNILNTYNLSDYLFYRECFKSESEVVPFQYITISDNVRDYISISNYDGDSYTGEHDDFVPWFNIDNNIPIITWRSSPPINIKYLYDKIFDSCSEYVDLAKKINNAKINRSVITSLMLTIRHDTFKRKILNEWHGDDDIEVPGLIASGKFIPDVIQDMSTDDILNDLSNYRTELDTEILHMEKHKEHLRDKLILEHEEKLPINIAIRQLDNKNIQNEINRIITQMMYILKNIADYSNIYHNADNVEDIEDDIPIIDFPTDTTEFKQLISIKYEEQIDKIQNRGIDAYRSDNMVDQYLDFFSPEIIDKILISSEEDTFNYHASGNYKDPTSPIEEYTCHAHFGFINIKST